MVKISARKSVNNWSGAAIAFDEVVRFGTAGAKAAGGSFLPAGFLAGLVATLAAGDVVFLLAVMCAYDSSLCFIWVTHRGQDLYPGLWFGGEGVFDPLAVVVKHTANLAAAVLKSAAFDGFDLTFKA